VEGAAVIDTQKNWRWTGWWSWFWSHAGVMLISELVEARPIQF